MAKITDAAQFALDEYISSREVAAKESILQRAASLSRLHEGFEIGVREVAQAIAVEEGRTVSNPDLASERSEAALRQQRSTQRIAVIYAGVGVVGSFAASSFQLFQARDRSNGLTYPVLVAAAGATIAVVGFALLAYTFWNARRSNFLVKLDSDLRAQFISSWYELEWQIHTRSGNTGTLLQNLESAMETGLLTREDVLEVQGLLRLRNKLLHDRSTERPEDLALALSQAKLLTEQLIRDSALKTAAEHKRAS